MKEKFFGLIPGRHDLPEVSGCVFPETVNPMDFAAMDRAVRNFLDKEAGISLGSSVPINGTEDAFCFSGSVHINVYVTGLTAATADLISGCAINGVPLTLWHYNRETGKYEAQRIF